MIVDTAQTSWMDLVRTSRQVDFGCRSKGIQCDMGRRQRLIDEGHRCLRAMTAGLDDGQGGPCRDVARMADASATLEVTANRILFVRLFRNRADGALDVFVTLPIDATIHLQMVNRLSRRFFREAATPAIAIRRTLVCRRRDGAAADRNIRSLSRIAWSLVFGHGRRIP